MYLGRRPDVGLSSGCYLSPPRCNSVAVVPISRLTVCLGSVSLALSLSSLLLFSMPARFTPTVYDDSLQLPPRLSCCSLASSRSLAREFHDLPVIFLRRISSAGCPDSSGGSALKSGRFTDTSAAGDISLLNYSE